ncbi:DegV family protein [Lactobacillus acetotolerans]|uniref:DegV family protein n=1 Tax=Lactobacillus acetotolerans TaxID=1600 RepID=UPI002FDB6FA9
MSKIKIMTDSSVQLTPEEVKKYDITVVPLSVTIDGKTYLDGIDISRKEFIEKMDEAKELPKTSQPPIGRFVDAINKLTADGSDVLGIFLAKTLSGTIDAARQAAQITGKENKVHLVDSELTDRAEGFQVLAAAKDIEAGKELPEILKHIDHIKKTQKLHLVVVNLKNIIKGGRLGKLTGKVATLLNIQIELQMPGGHLIIAKKGRGKKFARAFNERVLDEIRANKDKIKEIGVSYVSTEDKPKPMIEFGKKIKAINNDFNVLVRETSPIISTHAGMNAYAILYYTE